MIAYVEYMWFNGCHTLDEADFVTEYFMGDSMGYSVLYAVRENLPEIGSYIPPPLQSIRYLRTIKDGLYVIGTTNEHASDLRCDEIQSTYLSPR